MKELENFWNKRYSETGYAYGKDPNSFFKTQLKNLSPGNILLVGEGEGRNAVFAALNNWTVEAFDLSEEGRKKALKLAEENQVSINYQIADALTIEYPKENFDVIALIFFHLPSPQRQIIHKKVQNWLKPNGTLLLEAFTTEQLGKSSGGPKDLSMLYTSQLLLEDFKELEIAGISEGLFALNEGEYHKGQANLIRLIAKK
jgi:SAM-dependent methyltransferase